MYSGPTEFIQKAEVYMNEQLELGAKVENLNLTAFLSEVDTETVTEKERAGKAVRKLYASSSQSSTSKGQKRKNVIQDESSDEGLAEYLEENREDDLNSTAKKVRPSQQLKFAEDTPRTQHKVSLLVIIALP